MKLKALVVHLAVAAALLSPAAFQTQAQAPAGGGMGSVLTDDQRTKLRESMQTTREELTPLFEKLVAAQKEALKAALAKEVDEKDLRAKLEAVSKIQTDLALKRLAAIKDVIASLTEEQKTQMTERPGLAYMLLLGGGFGGGQRGGGGGRGPGGGGGGNQ